jgi:hypothetical protein
MKTHVVYRYIDVTDNIIKYVGITTLKRLAARESMHRSQDIWRCKGLWRIEYFTCNNKSEAEAFESHLIALYDTGKYYNKAKTGWGLNQYLPDIEDKWILYKHPIYTDIETARAAALFHKLLKQGHTDAARLVLDCFVFEE